MKHIKGLRLFESSEKEDKWREIFLRKRSSGLLKLNPSTGLFDVHGNFASINDDLSSFYGVKFGKVYGVFKCIGNAFTTLDEFPREVEIDFNCENNALSSLKGSPHKVGRDFICSENFLTSLEGSPEKVGRSFNCSQNLLSSLSGAPQEVEGDFTCSSNQLTSLIGGPKKVKEDFDCSENELYSLEGAPLEVGGFFYCFNNKLNSLKGVPEFIGLGFLLNEFNIPPGKWNTEGWIEAMLKTGDSGKKLISTIPYFEPKVLEKHIQENPGKWVVALKGIWHSEEFKNIRDRLKVSNQFLKDVGDQASLSDLGF